MKWFLVAAYMGIPACPMEVNSKTACVQAATQIDEGLITVHKRFRYVCVPKGVETNALSH